MSQLPSVVTRFLRYTEYDTQADEKSHSTPSSPGQTILQNKLAQELKELGLKDVEVDEHSYLMATIESNIEYEVPTIGFIAHVDTAPDMSGKNVHAKIHPNYQGQPLSLNDQHTLTPEKSPELLNHIGDTIITTDGTSLLGADDKAGVAEIMSMVERLQNDKSIKHGRIRIAFTCDEELGQGTKYFDAKKFGCQYAYTLDGEAPGEIENETFCAHDLTFSFEGVNIHPGYAKDKMVNAIKAFAYFVSLFPHKTSPEGTEGREGYMHPRMISGDVEKLEFKVLLRDFEEQGIELFLKTLATYQKKTEKKYPGIKISMKDQLRYQNMRFILDQHPHVMEYAIEAVRRAGLEPKVKQIRGGTDGSHLCFMGLPTPNLFAGGRIFHSRYEWVAVSSMVKAVDTMVHLVQIWVEKSLPSTTTVKKCKPCIGVKKRKSV
ncbi:MAG: peptidase T [Candidatus Brocadiae bacterium]|nr:peptidase T [Candidatus Brocadiia bacterium]